LKTIITRIFKGLRSKTGFAVLCLLFVFLSIYLASTYGKVKGDTSVASYTVVLDEQKRTFVRTTSDDPREVLAQGNISIYPEDLITTDLILDPVTDSGAGQKITIKRAPVYYVSVDGITKNIRIWEPLVGEIIKKSEVTLAPKDKISYALEQRVTPGAEIIITRVKEADVAVFEDTPYGTINKSDTSIAFGQQKITQMGISGQIKKIYRAYYENGIEVSRRLLTKETTIAMQNKVISSGVITGQSNYGKSSVYPGLTTSFYKNGYMGKYLLVTNLSSGKQVRVKIVDFGPINGPILDLGEEAFELIGGSTSHGHIDRVSVQLVD
jgi:hypothetical protein